MRVKKKKKKHSTNTGRYFWILKTTNFKLEEMGLCMNLKSHILLQTTTSWTFSFLRLSPPLLFCLCEVHSTDDESTSRDEHTYWETANAAHHEHKPSRCWRSAGEMFDMVSGGGCPHWLFPLYRCRAVNEGFFLFFIVNSQDGQLSDGGDIHWLQLNVFWIRVVYPSFNLFSNLIHMDSTS